MLTETDLKDLTKFRRSLHRNPEVSGQESRTAWTVKTALDELSPATVLTGLGGHGVAAVFDSGQPGETVMFRAELDALPIEEISNVPWSSEVPGKGHLCGHDGHMTMLFGLGRLLSRKPPAKGRVVLLFQPAEEDGSGARAVTADPRFKQIAPDWAFAIHNLPGLPLGFVGTQAGLINCASKGLSINLAGKTAHAAEPSKGRSPAIAVAELIPVLTALGKDGPLNDEFGLLTITHASIGEPTFGIAPGEATIYATLRTTRDDAMEDLDRDVRAAVMSSAERHGLSVSFQERDVFAASINDVDAVKVAGAAMDSLGIPHGTRGVPMRASEDFGVFGWNSKAAMLCLGSGESHPALHNPDYDFPDELIPIGVSIFERIARDLLG
ncbi:amidohydrolase [Cognatishimia activa]|uniref:Putative hydrolase YxeP n=1 Tax=Cognatishimia activa TaxID=1715691 RepID=A0A0N7MB91_9RHOB|nr:amidohydrolase [Cognatishimia activa]CUI36858.1 putative hydrolase YxeP [Cognatishimia activa]CUK24752.1 putative hydrolase YxeP [Cognatishimia activa]